MEAKDYIPNEYSLYFNLGNMLGQKEAFQVRSVDGILYIYPKKFPSVSFFYRVSGRSFTFTI